MIERMFGKEYYDKYMKEARLAKFRAEQEFLHGKSEVALPKYKVEEKDPTYKMKRGIVMKATSDLHDDKDGKRYITTDMKVWKDLTPKDKKALKKSIMIALEHKLKGGCIKDLPTDIGGVVKSLVKHFEGKGFLDDLKRAGSNLAPTLARKMERTIVPNVEQRVKQTGERVQKLKGIADEINKKKATEGSGIVHGYYKPNGTRQLIYFSDTSSDEDEPYLPIKRGRGRPRKCEY